MGLLSKVAGNYECETDTNCSYDSRPSFDPSFYNWSGGAIITLRWSRASMGLSQPIIQFSSCKL